MLFLGIAAPGAFFVLLFALAWLEDTVVRPLEKAYRVATLLESASPDQVEAVIAHMFASDAPRRADQAIAVRS